MFTMYKTTLVTILLATPVALALQPGARLLARQDSLCSPGWVTCGVDNCMPAGDTCCSDGSYCPAGDYCDIGNNGLGACCPIGKLCTGNGGTSATTFTHTLTLTNTKTLPATTTASTPIHITTMSTPTSTSSSAGISLTTSTPYSTCNTTLLPSYPSSGFSNTTATATPVPVQITGAGSPSSHVASGLVAFAFIAFGRLLI